MYTSEEVRSKYPRFIKALRRSTTFSPTSPGLINSSGKSLFHPPVQLFFQDAVFPEVIENIALIEAEVL